MSKPNYNFSSAETNMAAALVRLVRTFEIDVLGVDAWGKIDLDAFSIAIRRVD